MNGTTIPTVDAMEARITLPDEREIPYDNVHVDFMSGDDRTQVLGTLRKLNPEITFPTIVIGDKVIAGFRRDEIEAALKECNMGTEVQAATWQQP